MRRVFTFLTIFLSLFSISKAQQSQLDWIIHGTSPNILFGEGVSTDNDGNAFFTGYFNTWLVIDEDTTIVESERNSMFLAKVSPQNEIQWLVTAESDTMQGVTGFKSYYKNGYVYLMGDLRGTATFGSMDFVEQTVSANEYRTMYIAKYATNGVLEWVRTITTSNSIGMVMTGGTHDLVVDNTGAVYFSTSFRNSLNIAGTEVPDPTPDENLFNAVVAKLDANGAYQWHWTTTNSGADNGQAININENNELFFTVRYADSLSVGGHVHATNGSGGFALIEFDLLGNYEWHAFMTTESSIATGVRCFSMEFDDENNIYLAGSYRTGIFLDQENFLPIINSTRSDGFIIKFDGSTKDWLWGKEFGDPDENADIRTIAFTSQDNFMVAGVYRGEMVLNDDLVLESNEGSADGFWAVVDKDGEVSDGFGFGGASNEVVSQMAVSPNDDVYIIGRFQNEFVYGDIEFNAWGSFDFFLIKLGSLSQDASLASIEIDGEPLPGFDPETFSYTVSLPSTTEDVPQVSAIPSVPNAEVDIEQAVSLTGEETDRTATITVTAADAETTETYFVVFRLKSSDSSLAEILLDGEPLPDFDAEIFAYEIVIPSVEQIPEITAVPNDENATVEISEPLQEPGDDTWWIVEITVFAEDTDFLSSYHLSFRQVSDDATLTQINLDGIILADFDPEVLHYEVELPPITTDVPFVEAIPSSPYAQVNITQASSLTGDEEDRTATILVTAEDGTSLTYTILFTLEETSVSEINNESFVVYPNPATDVIYFDLPSGKNEIFIYNVTGSKVIKTDNLEISGKINVESLPAGIYFLKLQNNRGISKVQRLIIKR
ncbi:MAG: T9SS C-terminal target domain-containing protein [Bacteroidetes bacterium]|nr:MAG: T9SS C-terminal target domain-containing protein [Bacteroidota bacterium]